MLLPLFSSRSLMLLMGALLALFSMVWQRLYPLTPPSEPGDAANFTMGATKRSAFSPSHTHLEAQSHGGRLLLRNRFAADSGKEIRPMIDWPWGSFCRLDDVGRQPGVVVFDILRKTT